MEIFMVAIVRTVITLSAWSRTRFPKLRTLFFHILFMRGKKSHLEAKFFLNVRTFRFTAHKRKFQCSAWFKNSSNSLLRTFYECFIFSSFFCCLQRKNFHLNKNSLLLNATCKLSVENTWLRSNTDKNIDHCVCSFKRIPRLTS